ncbi:hypothetical protein ABZP36_000866 [Zizania latifolia]
MALSPADPNRSRRQGRTKEEGRGKRRSRVTGAQARARPTASPATHHFSPLPTLRVTAARRSTGSDPLGRTSRVLTPPLLLLLPRRNDDIILALALALALACNAVRADVSIALVSNGVWADVSLTCLFVCFNSLQPSHKTFRIKKKLAKKMR